MNIRNLAGSARALAVMALVFMIAGTTAMFGQQITGTIVGTVKDRQGAVINTATVKATNVDTGFTRSAPTNGYGEYRIDYLPVGKYTVEATAAGFERFVQKNIALDVDQTLTIDITLAVGAQSQTVTVTEAPPVVNTSDAVLGSDPRAERYRRPADGQPQYLLRGLAHARSDGQQQQLHREPHRHPHFRHWTVHRGCADQRLH